MRLVTLNLKLFLCSLALLALAGCESAGGSSPESVVVGSNAPDFALSSLDGTTVKSSSLKGNVVVLNFWATWCQPCMGEIPELKEFAASSKVKVVGIALDEDGLKVVKPFVENNKIDYTVLLGDQEVFQRFNGLGIPYTLVLDRSQRIVKIYRGPATRASLEEDVKMIERGS
ncbi:MAG TPA: TlpA disulfide reductase family protein [Pyrinomonadaceae bacterium]|nr:TlpA disulfide reductase family protein [Pyrinomonadaceae bacterium]